MTKPTHSCLSSAGQAQAAAPAAGHARDLVFPESIADTPAGAISYRQCGGGNTAVVLLHGIGSGAGSWWECAALLGQHSRVVAWNAPGYANSASLPMPVPTASDYARQLRQLVDALKLERLLLVGHSLGALMASAYSSLYPEQLAGLLLFSPALGYGSAQQAERSKQVRLGRLETLHSKGIKGMAQALPARLLSANATDAQRAEVQYNASRIRPDGYAQAVELLCGDDIYRYAVPSHTHVYCGDSDTVTTPEQSANYAQNQGLAFDLVKQAGHACYVEQPAQVATFINSALTRA